MHANIFLHVLTLLNFKGYATAYQFKIYLFFITRGSHACFWTDFHSNYLEIVSKIKFFEQFSTGVILLLALDTLLNTLTDLEIN